MPNIHRNTTATFRRQRLTKEINVFRFVTMRPYSTYVKSGVLYKVGPSLEVYAVHL